MRIAIPVTKESIPNHLGHCEAFLIADVEGGAIIEETLVPNPGHGPGGPPPIFLARQGVEQVLAWGMPGRAREMFAGLGLHVQLGATGDARQALREYLAGTIRYSSEGLDAGGGCEPSPHDE